MLGEAVIGELARSDLLDRISIAQVTGRHDPGAAEGYSVLPSANGIEPDFVPGMGEVTAAPGRAVAPIVPAAGVQIGSFPKAAPLAHTEQDKPDNEKTAFELISQAAKALQGDKDAKKNAPVISKAGALAPQSHKPKAKEPRFRQEMSTPDAPSGNPFLHASAAFGLPPPGYTPPVLHNPYAPQPGSTQTAQYQTVGYGDGAAAQPAAAPARRDDDRKEKKHKKEVKSSRRDRSRSRDPPASSRRAPEPAKSSSSKSDGGSTEDRLAELKNRLMKSTLRSKTKRD